MTRHRDPDEDVSLDPIVWTLTQVADEGDFTIGIFSTEEKATTYLDEMNHTRAERGWGPLEDAFVEEYELDPIWNED